LPDPDRYHFQANEKVKKVDFFRKFQFAVQNTAEHMTHLTLMRKIKDCEMAML
jgi:hypothetical protein